jgi:DNA-binding NarL/FixJ family response regulator
MKTETPIVIVDDHSIFRHGLRAVIEAEEGLKVIADVGNGEDALRLSEELRPDIIISDVDMPGMDGFQLVRELRRRKLPAEIIFLTIHSDEDMLNEALSLGVKGYVLKDSSASDIIHAIKALQQGHHFTSPSITTQLVNRTERARHGSVSGVNDLTLTERRVMRLISEYKTSKEIAEELCIHHRTVDNHRTNISSKLGLHGSHALIKFALRHKGEL